MAEEQQERKTAKVSVTNRGDGPRFFHDANGAMVLLQKGETREDVEVLEADSKRMKMVSDQGGDLDLGGGKRAKAEKEEEKEMTRAELEELEQKNLEEGQKQHRERVPLKRSADAGGKEKQQMTRGDLEAMTKDELAGVADSVEADFPASATKGDMIDAILKAQKK